MKEKNLKKLLLIFSIFIVPIHTILLASNASWLKVSLSVVGYELDRQTSFVIWGVVTGFLFLVYLNLIYKTTRFENRALKRLNFIAFILMVFAVTTPYLPELFPLKAFLDIVFAVLSPVCMIISLGIFIFTYMRKEKRIFHKMVRGYLFIIITSTLILFLSGIVNSLLEVFFTISMCIFFPLLCKWLDELD